MSQHEAVAAPKQSTTAASGILQRKCDGCRKKKAKGLLQRRAVRDDPVMDVPPIVHEVLRTPGQPLDAATREFMEPRFGHDFSRVRVHTDARAAESARAVNALAYTVGQDMTFAAGTYSPASGSGRRLIAHELTHIVQQLVGAPPIPIKIASISGPEERQAEEVAVSIAAGQEARLVRNKGQIRLQRYPNMAGRPLTEHDRDAAQRQLESTPYYSGIVEGNVVGARFVLHTAESPGVIEAGSVPDRISHHVSHGTRSSADTGAGAWVPRSGQAGIAHQPFFIPRRVTATQWERGGPGFSPSRIDDLAMHVWACTDSLERELILREMLVNQGSPPDEVRTAEVLAIRRLNGNCVGVPHGRPCVPTAGVWAVEDICNRVNYGGEAPILARENQEYSLIDACDLLSPITEMREMRASSTVNVEMFPPLRGETPSNIFWYTPEQYLMVMQLYLRAALESGRFPEIATHFATDRGIPWAHHDDPRCFNLGRLYCLIVRALMDNGAFTHPAGSRYGAEPSYGTGDTANVWWVNDACGGEHPRRTVTSATCE